MLDASTSIQIFQLLNRIQRARNVTLVFITHSLAAAHYLCHKIAVIYRGRVMETGPVSTIIRNPRHPYTQALLDALPEYGHSRPGHRYGALRSQARDEVTEGGCPFFSRCNFAQEDRCSRKQPDLKPVDEETKAACLLVSCSDPGGPENAE